MVLSNRNYIAIFLSALLIFYFTAASFAQDGSSQFIGEVTVGESKRDVQIDTPDPFTVVDQGEIYDRQAGTVAELIDSVPGVHLINGSTPQGSGINIRGFGANGTFGTDQKVMIYIDDAATGAEELYRIGNQLFTDPELYKSVSVIRGTVGSFEYGSGIIGGIVKLETKNASDLTNSDEDFKLRQSLQYSSNGNGLVTSTTMAVRPSDNLDFLGNFTLRRQSDQKSGDGAVIGSSEYSLPSYMLKGKYNFGQNVSQSLTLSMTNTTSDEKDVPYDTFQTTGGAFGNVDRETISRTFSVSYDFVPADNDLIDLNATLSYADQSIDQEYVPGSSFCASFPLPPGCRGPAPADGYSTVNADHRYETTKLTIKNTSLFDQFGMSHQLRTGFESLQKERKSADSAPGGTDARLALFLIDQVDVSSNLTVTPALRLETQTITDEQGLTGPYDNTALMGGISARQMLSDDVSVFYSRAYTESLPIMDDLYNAFSGRPQPDLMEKSEKSFTTEVGAAMQQSLSASKDDNLKVKLTLYSSDLSDVTSYSRIDAVERSGFEIEASYASSAGSYVDFNFDKSRGSAFDATGIETDWSNEPADIFRITFGRKFNSDLDLSWEISGATKFKNETTEIGTYAAHNLRATYLPNSGVLDGTEIRFGIENIGDRLYTPRLSTRPAAGRNFKLTLSRNF